VGGLVGSASDVRAEGPIIDVRKEADRRIAVGIPKLGDLPSQAIGSPPAHVIAFDLELSGWFQPVRAGVLPPRSLDDWERLGAEVVVELELDGDLTGRIVDVGTGDALFERSYGAGESLRRRLHRFCDDVVLALTGERGLARTRILCEWDPGEGKRIVQMDVDGFGLRELTGDQALELSPRWSADGTRAVYTSYAGGYPDVYVHDLRVGGRERVAHYEGLNAQGELSPDGEVLALTLSESGNPEIYSKVLVSGKMRRLTHQSGTDASPTWSPDGSRIAFVSDRTGSPQIYVMRPDGSNLERVTFRGNYNTAPDWSPDGTRIAYCALRSDGFQIQVIELDGGRVTTVTEGGGCEDPSWAPDGRAILYSRTAGGRTDLYVTNLSERRALRVSGGSGRYSAPDWSPFLDGAATREGDTR
jgi:TolB protein